LEERGLPAAVTPFSTITAANGITLIVTLTNHRPNGTTGAHWSVGNVANGGRRHGAFTLARLLPAPRAEPIVAGAIAGPAGALPP
jgi:hypothetical protein